MIRDYKLLKRCSKPDCIYDRLLIQIAESSPFVRIYCQECQEVLLLHSREKTGNPTEETYLQSRESLSSDNVSSPSNIIPVDANTVAFDRSSSSQVFYRSHEESSFEDRNEAQGEIEEIWPDLENYQITRKLGLGATGSVYLAKEEQSGKQVAIKIMQKTENPEILEYFLREAQILFQLHHPNIVKLKGQGNWKGAPYIVMEYIPGRTLEYILKKKRLDPLTATNVIYHVLKALKHAYQFQIIHRDIKPANILLTKQGQVKVIDLGLCKILDSAFNLTNTGQVLGTAYYMPPEQFIDSKRVDHRSDIYASGATLYHSLCGVPPFNEYSDDIQELMEAKIENRYIPLHERDSSIPLELVQITEKAMAHQANDRYSHAQEMRESLSIVYKKLIKNKKSPSQLE